jgi:photoactive yellow protein
MNPKHDDIPPIEPAHRFRWAATYGVTDIHNALAAMSAEEVDRLPFGVIKVDRKGTILFYNATEGRLAGFDPSKVVGHNFFRDIAPCTNRPEFLGRFLDGVQAGRFDVTFRYDFSFPIQPAAVTVQMRSSYFDDSIWILIDWDDEPAGTPDPMPSNEH